VRNSLAWLVAAASGAALWAGVNLAESSQEPWDSGRYWTTYLPLAALLCLVLGFGFPEKPWRWPLAVMLAQLPVMILFTGKVGAFLVLGVVLLLLLSLPGMIAAWLGAGAHRWIERRAGD